MYLNAVSFTMAVPILKNIYEIDEGQIVIRRYEKDLGVAYYFQINSTLTNT